MRIHLNANAVLCRCGFCAAPLEGWRRTREHLSKIQDERDYHLMLAAQACKILCGQGYMTNGQYALHAFRGEPDGSLQRRADVYGYGS